MSMRLLPIISTLGVVSATNTEGPAAIGKVVTMLKDMRKELETDRDADETMYKKMTCTCKDDKKEFAAQNASATKAIEANEQKYATEYARYKSEEARHNQLTKDFSAAQASLESAQNVHGKETKEWQKEKTDLEQNITALKNAVTVLKKQNPGPKGLVQLESVANQLAASQKARNAVAGIRSLLKSVREENKTSFLQTAGNPFQSYTSQSGKIFGIISEMADEMSRDLKEGKDKYAQALAAHNELVGAKQAEKATLEASLAKAASSRAAAQKAFNAADATVKAEREKLRVVVSLEKGRFAKCADMDQQYQDRTASRAEEISAVGETITILNNDPAFHHLQANGSKFSDTKLVSFVQVGITSRSEKVKRVVSLLEKSSNPKIMLIAAYAKLDAFTKVKEAIDNMVSQLKAVQAEEVVQRDECIQNFSDNKAATEKHTDEKDNAHAAVESLKAQIAKLNEDIAANTKENAEANTSIARASDERQTAHVEYEKEIQDERMVQGILQRAYDRMAQKYGAFFQMEKYQEDVLARDQYSNDMAFGESGAVKVENRGQGDTEARTANMNKGGNKVLSNIKMIIDDSKKTESEAALSNKKEQSAYESEVKDLNYLIKKNNEELIKQNADLADANDDLLNQKNLRATALDQLENDNKEKNAFHQQCDFLMEHFGDRQDSRTQEMNALTEAKQILSGMN